MAEIVDADEMLARGLQLIGYTRDQQGRMSLAEKHADFKAHFGSGCDVMSDLWFGLCTTTIATASLTQAERSARGFKMFMAAIFFLWTNPKKKRLMKSRFGISLSYLQGEMLWKWVRKVAALKATKIIWDDRFNDDNYHIFIVSVDGVDFNVTEKKHPIFNVDAEMFSEKHNHAGLRYLIALHLWEPRCVFVDGPVKPGRTNDLAHFRQGASESLKQKMLLLPGKIGVADRGYQTSKPNETGLIAISSTTDPPDLRQFKSRARSRHESFNGRLKNFKILDDTFVYTIAKHKVVVEAICVIVQYQMDNGAPLFEV